MRTLGRRIADKTLSENVLRALGRGLPPLCPIRIDAPLRMRDSVSCADHPHGELYRLATMS